MVVDYFGKMFITLCPGLLVCLNVWPSVATSCQRIIQNRSEFQIENKKKWGLNKRWGGQRDKQRRKVQRKGQKGLKENETEKEIQKETCKR